MEITPNFIGNNISGKQNLLMNPLNKFYSKDNNIQQIIPFLTGKSKVSLRVIDWFATNYSKKNNIIYYIDKPRKRNSPKVSTLKKKKSKSISYSNVPNGDKSLQFNVYLNYKSQLKAYSKKQFDPFCRRDRIEFFYNNKKNSIITTVGQLNFFRWALENKILDYIQNNLNEIESDMNQNIRKPETKLSKKKSKLFDCKKTERRKRKELSSSATNTINKHKVSIILDFD